MFLFSNSNYVSVADRAHVFRYVSIFKRSAVQIKVMVHNLVLGGSQNKQGKTLVYRPPLIRAP